MTKSICLAVLFLASGFALPELPERFAKRLESIELNYQSAVQKADHSRTVALHKASQERLKAIKSILSDATKSGDFDSATEVKARLVQTEAKGAVRPRPAATIKFEGHEYAMVDIGATWHVGKRMCEEMGGHLVIVNSQFEADLIIAMCQSAAKPAWVGASDEESEGHWKWMDGTDAQFTSPHVSRGVNNFENSMTFDLALNNWNDIGAGRAPFICEWDN